MYQICGPLFGLLKGVPPVLTVAVNLSTPLLFPTQASLETCSVDVTVPLWSAAVLLYLGTEVGGIVAVSPKLSRASGNSSL